MPGNPTCVTKTKTNRYKKGMFKFKKIFLPEFIKRFQIFVRGVSLLPGEDILVLLERDFLFAMTLDKLGDLKVLFMLDLSDVLLPGFLEDLVTFDWLSATDRSPSIWKNKFTFYWKCN